MADEVCTWTDPASSVTTLTVEWGAKGRYLPAIDWQEEAVPFGAGSRLRSVRHKSRTMTLPLWVQGTDDVSLRSAVRALVYAMDPTRGDGTLSVTGPDGNTRSLLCRCNLGLELSERYAEDTHTIWQRIQAQFQAVWPYWRDAADTTSTYTYSGTPAATFFPIPNATTGSFRTLTDNTTVVATPTINVTGDAAAWPVWTVTGPVSGQAVIRNDTIGKWIDIAITLGSTETLTIDTRPDPLSSTPGAVLKNGTTNVYGLLSSTSTLWSLQPGNNVLRFELASPSTSSGVTLAYRNSYLTV